MHQCFMSPRVTNDNSQLHRTSSTRVFYMLCDFSTRTSGMRIWQPLCICVCVLASYHSLNDKIIFRLVLASTLCDSASFSILLIFERVRIDLLLLLLLLCCYCLFLFVFHTFIILFQFRFDLVFAQLCHYPMLQFSIDVAVHVDAARKV